MIPYNPLAGGLLTGKHRSDAPPTEGTRFTLGSAATNYQNRYWHEREFEAVEDIRLVADEAGLPMTQMAIAWVLANPAITAPIIGASRPEQLRDSINASIEPLSSDVKERLDDITEEYRMGDAVRERRHPQSPWRPAVPPPATTTRPPSEPRGRSCVRCLRSATRGRQANRRSRSSEPIV